MVDGADSAERTATLHAAVEVFSDLAEPILPRLAAALRSRHAEDGPWDTSLTLDTLSSELLSSADPRSSAYSPA